MRLAAPLIMLVVHVVVLAAEPPVLPCAVADPVVRKLVEKRVLTPGEACEAAGGRDKLVALLVRKGIFTDGEARELGFAEPVPAPVLIASADPEAVRLPAAPPAAAAAPQAVVPPPPAPAVIPAVAPLRVMPIEPVRREGLAPDISLGTGARLKPYGFIKASAIYDSSSPSGTDMPVPYLNGDTGPTAAPEFHIRARNFRFGSQFEWLDISPKWAITGRFEADFEGSFTRAMNRNISSVRSSMFSLRTAYGRIDYRQSDRNDFFVLVGQDWTPFGSSTMPNMVETTGLGLGYGTLYERLPMIKFGYVRNLGGARHWKFSPEFAVLMPAFGNTPANLADQEGYGERQGADSGRPEVQGRFVWQWDFDRAPGVAPAQLIASWTQAERAALVRAADVPPAYRSAFSSGTRTTSDRWGYTLELQLPTRWVTWQGKYFRGKDLRFYFVGGLYSNFNDAAGLTSVASASSIDGASTVLFGMRDGRAAVAPQLGVRTQGLNTDLGLPISRWFGANPSGRNAGWSANLHYSLDTVPARDARRMPGVRAKSDMAAFTLNYRLNLVTTLQFEQSHYRSRAANASASDPGGLFTLRGIPARNWHNNRSELGLLLIF